MRQRSHRRTALLGILAAVLLLAACANTPMGPTVQVLPAEDKSVEQFQAEQADCTQYAEQTVAGQTQSANQQAAGTAAVGTLLGAAVGAGIGAVAGNAGTGTAIGAGAGLAGGAGLGASNSSNAQLSIQDQYNNAYAQCMYAKGNIVPGYEPMVQESPPPPAPVPPHASNDLVRATQVQLIRLGYLHTRADGVMGPKTSNAISRFQRVSWLPVNGSASPALLARLEATP